MLECSRRNMRVTDIGKLECTRRIEMKRCSLLIANCTVLSVWLVGLKILLGRSRALWVSFFRKWNRNSAWPTLVTTSSSGKPWGNMSNLYVKYNFYCQTIKLPWYTNKVLFYPYFILPQACYPSWKPENCSTHFWRNTPLENSTQSNRNAILFGFYSSLGHLIPKFAHISNLSRIIHLEN